MNVWQQAQAEMKSLIKQAQALIEQHGQDGTLPPEILSQVETLYSQAEAKKAEMEAARKADEARAKFGQLDGWLTETTGRRSREDMGEAKRAGAPQDTGAALYEARYGEPPRAVKTLARELYGDDYEGMRLHQWRAINKWFRQGDSGLKAEDWAVLRQPILTPSQIEQAVKLGMDLMQVKATLVEASDTLGGVFVPEDIRLNIIQRMAGLTVVRGLALGISTSRDAVEWPKLLGGTSRYTSAVRVSWTGEVPPNTTFSETNPSFGFERIPIHTVMASTYFSRNLLEDAAVDVVGIVTRLFAEAAAIDEDEQFLVGSGTGKPQGILPGSTNALGLTEVVSGHATLINSIDPLKKLKRAVNAQYRSQTSGFIGNSTTGQAIELLKDGDGLYMVPDLDDGLLRKRWLESEAMPDIGANTYPIVYGDLGGYAIVDRVGMTVERYMDSTQALNNRVLYVMRRRLGGQVVEPWRFAALKVSV